MYTLSTHFVGALLALCFLAVISPAHADNVDDYIRAEMHHRHIPGLSLAVVKEGKVLKMKGYGLANLETRTPATPDTVFKIASISKQFLATGILLLANEGKLNLDDSASKFLEGTPEIWKDITVRHLITHTSGLVEDPPGFEPFKALPDTEVIRRAYLTPLLSAPGEKWRYSNLSYFLLGEIIRKVSGKPWNQYLTETLFAPAGMTMTRTTTTTEVVPDRADGYNWVQGQWRKEPDWVAVRPSGAFLSTVRDMVRWDSRLSSDRSFLTPVLRTQLWTPTRLNNGTTYDYGLGWFLDDWQGNKRTYHQGGLPGFTSDIERFTGDKLTVIVLTNASNADPQKIALHVAGFYNPALAPAVAPPLTDTEPEVTARFTAMIRGFVRGDVDTNLFAPEMASAITPAMKSRIADDLRYAGPIRSITLISRKEIGEKQQYRYRLAYRNYAYVVQCTFDRNGKIVDVGSPRE